MHTYTHTCASAHTHTHTHAAGSLTQLLLNLASLLAFVSSDLRDPQLSPQESGPSLLSAVVYCGVFRSRSDISAMISAKGFRFCLIWSAPEWFWSSWSPAVSAESLSLFFFFSVALNHCGSCTLPVYMHWRYKYAHLLPCLIFCNPHHVHTLSLSLTHTNTHPHTPSTYLGVCPRTDIARYFLLPQLLTSGCLTGHGEFTVKYFWFKINSTLRLFFKRTDL